MQSQNKQGRSERAAINHTSTPVAPVFNALRNSSSARTATTRVTHAAKAVPIVVLMISQMPLPPNDKRSHAGPITLGAPQNGIPALAAAAG